MFVKYVTPLRRRAAALFTAGIVLTGLISCASTALLLQTAINAIARAHDGARWIAETRSVVQTLDDTVERLDAAQQRIGVAVDNPGGELDSTLGLQPAAAQGEQQIRVVARDLPGVAAAFLPLMTIARARSDALQTASALAQQGRLQEARAILAGPTADWREQMSHGHETIPAAGRQVVTGWLAKEARWRARVFWMVMLGGAVSVLATAVATIAAILAFERWRTQTRALHRARAAVARSERGRNSFLQTVGHDLRQPLQAIGLFATGLERHLSDSDSQQLLEGMRSAAASMNRMLSGLMDASRFDAGAVKVAFADLSLDHVLEPIEAEFSAMAQSKGIDLAILPAPLAVHSDPVLLESILRNLVSNAVRYTRRGRVEVACEAQDGRVLVRVSDTGIGIPAGDLDNIFQDFFRVSENGRSSEGLGLGLGLVRRMAGLLDVPVTVRSVVGSGSVFTLSIRMAEASPASPLPARPPAAATATPEQRLAGMRVLLVDDDEPVRQSLRAELQSRGMVVTIAADPEEAYALFEAQGQSRFDIVLMDRDLQSTITGPELLDRLAASYGVMLPALVLSGTTDFRVIQELQDSDYPWLSKPVPIPVLLREMQRRLGPEPSPAPSLVTPAA